METEAGKIENLNNLNKLNARDLRVRDVVRKKIVDILIGVCIRSCLVHTLTSNPNNLDNLDSPDNSDRPDSPDKLIFHLRSDSQIQPL